MLLLITSFSPASPHSSKHWNWNLDRSFISKNDQNWPIVLWNHNNNIYFQKIWQLFIMSCWDTNTTSRYFNFSIVNTTLHIATKAYSVEWTTKLEQINHITVLLIRQCVISQYQTKNIARGKNTHCGPINMSLLCLAINLTCMNQFWYFLAQMLLRKYTIKRYFIFPPHLTSASALPVETQNPEIASVCLNAACVVPKTHETH